MKHFEKIGFLMTAMLGIYLLTGCGSNETVFSSDPITPDQFPQAMLQGEYERIYNQLSEEFRKTVSLKELRELAEPFQEGIGSYQQLVKEQTDGLVQYIWVDDKNEKGLLAVFDETYTIHGLLLQPLTTYPDTDNRYTEIYYSLPFTGEWYTYWGGTNVLLNYHYEYKNQRYAFDFIIIKDGSSYQGDPNLNESYFAFGQNVLAPADGKVVQVVNSIRDNKPGIETNTNEPAGNHVVIDHGNGEYSIIAHFKQNSIRVNVGDEVKKGDLLGLCGNSGNSSEPHIHFQVSDSPDLFDGNSIRIRFENNLDLKKGDFISG
jgi:hypothetical protein